MSQFTIKRTSRGSFFKSSNTVVFFLFQNNLHFFTILRFPVKYITFLIVTLQKIKTYLFMKKSILLFAFIILSLFSCSSDDNNNSSIDTTQLVGSWLLESAKLDGEEVGSSDEVLFTSNGRAFYTYFNFGTNGQDITENADYSLNGNTIIVTYDDADLGYENDIFQILELTSTKLKVKSTDDEGTLIETYTK